MSRDRWTAQPVKKRSCAQLLHDDSSITFICIWKTEANAEDHVTCGSQEHIIIERHEKRKEHIIETCMQSKEAKGHQNAVKPTDFDTVQLPPDESLCEPGFIAEDKLHSITLDYTTRMHAHQHRNRQQFSNEMANPRCIKEGE